MKKKKVYVLEIFFQDERDVHTFIDNHFNDEQEMDVRARLKNGWDQLHLKSYTKKRFVMKPRKNMDAMAHLWIRPKQNFTLEEMKEDLQKQIANQV